MGEFGFWGQCDSCVFATNSPLAAARHTEQKPGHIVAEEISPAKEVYENADLDDKK